MTLDEGKTDSIDSVMSLFKKIQVGWTSCRDSQKKEKKERENVGFEFVWKTTCLSIF